VRAVPEQAARPPVPRRNAAAAAVVAEEKIMNRTFSGFRLGVLAACMSIALPAALHAQAATYPTADAAATALVDAVDKHDDAAMKKVLGPDWKTYIPTGDIDREDVDAFLANYHQSHKIVETDGASRLAIGKSEWTLPIPIVKNASGWMFDVKAARDEIRMRQIGRNELESQQSVLAFYDAEREYATHDHNDDGIHEYAQKFISTPGKRDGLYWEAKEGEPESPLGPRFADVAAPKGHDDGYHGYHYHILTSQGPSAPGGAYNYIVGGRMRNGFAAIAWPVRYGETGVMSFMISHDGVVFEKNLGKDGGKIAAAMKSFDPDDSWHEDDDLPQ
jgi:hypothetical protein